VVFPIKGDGLLDRRARFEHALVAHDHWQIRLRLPGLLVARHPVEGETLGIDPALGPAIIVAEINRAVMLRSRRHEPDPRLAARPVFVIAKQDSIGVGQHEDRAGSDRQGDNAPECQGQQELRWSSQWVEWLLHISVTSLDIFVELDSLIHPAANLRK
jgi:hypothetical protein